MGRSRWIRVLLVLSAAAVVPACGGGGGGVLVIVNAKAGSKGGTATTGFGGFGGFVEIYNEAGGNVVVSPSGTVSAPYLEPPILTPYLGTNPYTVSGTVTMTTVAALTGKDQILRGGTVNNFFGDDGTTPATGLHVLPGSTLTIPAHYDSDDTDVNGPAIGTFEAIYINLPNAILIEGTLQFGKIDSVAQDDGLGTDSAAVDDFTATSLIIRGSGSLLGRGADNPGGLGGDGSNLDNNWNINIVVNQGLLDVSGGNGDDGGDAGGISVDLQGLWNSGSILTRGGDGANGNGGDGDSQHWDVDTGSYGPGIGYFGGHNAGLIDTSGGNATNGDGGSAGDLELDPHDSIGSDICPGIFRARGGSVLGGDGNGGNADDFGPDVGDGELVFTGIVDLSGGDGSGTGDGGNGASFDCTVDTGNTLFSPDEIAGRVEVSAQIILGGGNGVNGGSGGGLSLGIATGTNNGGSPGLHIVRYIAASVDSSGGEGATGGPAGGIDVTTDYTDDSAGVQYAGGIDVSSPLVARGGRGTTANGGFGGSINLSTPLDNLPIYARSIVAGDLDSSGGSGEVSGGIGGSIYIECMLGVTVPGSLSTNGGAGAAASNGGDAGSLIVVGHGSATLLGGSATATGGTGGTAGADGTLIIDGIIVQP